MKISEIRIENLTHGCITDKRQPEIAFTLESDTPGTRLTKAVARIGSWEKCCDIRQTGIVYDGPSLYPFMEYEVEVTADDNHGNRDQATCRFQTGRLQTRWDAEWITAGDYQFTDKTSPIPMTFRRTFQRTGKIRRAFITATAIGIYELELNGQKIGDEYFAPGLTSYKKTLQYQYYDVTDFLQEENELIAVVGGGWAVGRFTYDSKNRITMDKQAFLLELFLEHEDGSMEKIVTDSSWQVTMEGNYRFGDFYDGEVYDATVDRNQISWKYASEIRLPFNPEITSSYGCPVTRQETLYPISWFRTEAGKTIYDFGQNFAGVLQLELTGTAGQMITIRHAEILEEGELCVKSLRTAKATLQYTCIEGKQTYSPRLTYMGFRYIEVAGIEPENIEIAAFVLHSDIEEVGSFSCSHEGLNQLQHNIRWSGKSNFVDIPTDCPQRDERQGWTGDLSIFARTACYNFDMSRFLDKWLKDVQLEQGRGGGIPMVVPQQGNPWPAMTTACWGDCCILVPWAEYLARGNEELLRRQYPVMKRFLRSVKFWAGLSGFGKRKYIWERPFQYGDWCAPEGDIKQWMRKGKWIATAYYANSCEIVSHIAGVLGEKKDQEYYALQKEKISEAYREIFTDGAGKLNEEFQSAYVLPLYFDMMTGVERENMAANLHRLVEEKEYHLNTGFPSTPYILFALADNGYVEDAYRILLQTTCPSWLYEVEQGATTFWEQWDVVSSTGEIGTASLNHYAYGAVGDFFYRRILGVEALEGGYRQFAVRPVLGGGLTSAEGQIKTPYGLVRVVWSVEDETFTITVEVPVSTTCEIVLPSGVCHRVGSGVHIYQETNTQISHLKERGIS